MWICSRCQVSNKEGHARCIQCGAPRTARRFGAGTPVAAPSVTDASQVARPIPVEADIPPPPRPQPDAVRPALRSARPEAVGKRVVRCAMGRLLVVFGLILAVLLPAIVGLLAVVHQKTVQPAVLGVLLPAETIAPPVLDTVLYVLCAVLAAVLAALPGLTAAGLGRLLIRLTPPERKPPSA